MDIPGRRKSEKYSGPKNVIRKNIKNTEEDSIRGSSEQILRLSCENHNNPEKSCDSSEVGISLTQPIFHHVLLKKNDSSRPNGNREADDKQSTPASSPYRRFLLFFFTFGMTSLYIKQRIEVFLLRGVLHIDLAIWTLEEGNEIIKWC